MEYLFKNVTPSRSHTMRSIKGKNTSIEIKLRKALFARGLRYRINYKNLPGSPDIIFPNKKVAIFCDSDFWHGKTLRQKKKTLKNNRRYWIRKIQDNIERDKRNNRDLKALGWQVTRFWETDIQNNFDKVIKKLLKILS